MNLSNSISNGISNGIANSFSTEGRMSRSAYWWFALFCVILLAIFVPIVGTISYQLGNLLADVGFYYILVIPGIRRLHDIDKSGSTAFWALLPIIGWLYLFILYCRPSDPEDNYYGSRQE